MEKEQPSKSLRLIKVLTNWMDNKFTIPGTNIKLGIDAIIGLIPGVGDIASTSVSLGILGITLQKGVPFKTAIKMMGNILFDAIITLIPFAGFFMDVAFKANTRNLRLLEEHLDKNEEGKYYFGVWWLFGITVVVCFAIIIGISALLFMWLRRELAVL